MLNAMRNRVSSVLVTALMGVLIASFAIWGIGDVFRFGGSNVIATIGEARITPAAFAREFENEVRRWQQQLGTEFSMSQARSLGLHRQVLARMVSRASFDQAAQQLGLRASDEQVRLSVAGNKAFQNSFGEFDKAIYESILQRIGFTPAGFEDATREDLTRDQLLTTLGSAAHVPDALSKLLYTYRAEKREIDILKVSPSGITNVPTPAEDDLRAYYAAHKDQFMAPEYRGLAYLLITAKELAKGVAVTEEEIQAYYDDHIDNFVTPERRVIEQIVLFDKDEAERAYAALKDGEDFLAVAKRFAGVTASDVKLGEKSQHQLGEDISPAAAQRAFAVKPNVPTEPQQSAFGWHILRTTEVIPGARTTLEQAHDLVEREARHEAALDQLFDMANTIEDELASGGGLEEVASTAGVDIIRIEAVDSTGHTPSGDSASGVPDIPGFLREAFSLEPNEEPVVKEASSDGYYVLSVTGVTPRTLKPFEEVRDAVLVNWTMDERSRLAKDRAETLATAAAESNLSALATGNESVQKNIIVVRDPQAGGTDVAPDIRHTAFSTKPGAAGVTTAADGDGFLVIKVKSRIPGNPAAEAEQLKTVDEAVERQYGNDVFGTYQSYLERTLGFTYNEKLLEDTISQIADQPR